MYHNRKMEQRINNILKSALKLVYEGSHDLKFQGLLPIDKSVSVYQKTFSYWATEIFKSKTGVSPELMNDIFHFVKRIYNLKSNHTIYHGSKSLSSLASKLWDLLRNSIKNSASLKEFKTKINN